MSDFNQLKNGKKFKHAPLNLPDMEAVTDSETGKRYYVTPEGYHYDSMTTALNHRAAPAIAKWKKRIGEDEAQKIIEYSQSRGDTLHAMCEAYLRNNDEELAELESQNDKIRLQFKRIRPILDKIELVTGIEEALYSDAYELAGRTDCIGVYDGVPSVIDFKTSRKTKKKEWCTDYFLQTTGYSLFLEEMIGIKVPQLVIIIMVDGAEPQIFIEQRDNYVELFNETIKTYRELKEQGEE